ncbi:amidohydrolase family protein [Massilia sp. TS11]|uniref:amidohydrolase family protein n=1 Tax=Massilia sp. TS11 TaxID=2908003 RepID=UPI001EDA309A|nr:amidohydrolase family protein [Massilia sp. TS11]MCG2586219.1 amidohydrolase family protein [Massilia sp. TS11]
MQTTFKTLIAAVGLACAQYAAAGTVAITNATIYTADSAGIIKNGTVLVKDERIVAVGTSVKLPEGATVIDAKGRVLTPGFFAPLSNLGVVEIEGVNETNDHAVASKRYSAALDMADAYNPHSTRIPIAYVDGVTRAMVYPGTKRGGSLIAGQGMVVNLGDAKRWMVKPHAAMFAEFGEQGAALSGTRASAVLALREAFEQVKGTAKAKPQMDDLLSALDVAALKPVLAGQVPLVMSVNRASDIEAALALAREYKLKLVIDGGSEAWMVAEQLAKAKVPVILNPLSVLPSHFEDLGARADNAKLLQQAGVMVAFSSDATETYNPRVLRQLAGNAVNGGLDPQAALAAVTINPARLYGVDKQLGSIAPGKQADLVLWDGEPLELTSHPAAVYIDGKLMPTTTRQTELRDRYMRMWKLK